MFQEAGPAGLYLSGQRNRLGRHLARRDQLAGLDGAPALAIDSRFPDVRVGMSIAVA